MPDKRKRSYVEPHFDVPDQKVERIAAKDLGLIEHAKSAAAKLEKDFPEVVFTSGARTVAQQASAMAGNVVTDRKWIEKTYQVTDERKELQDWVDDNPDAKTKSQIAAGLEGIMNGWTVDQKYGFSRHMSALAFDVKPTDDDELKQAIKDLPNLREFFDKEGGLIIWHADFIKKT